jgi:ankyrin repeat protein
MLYMDQTDINNAFLNAAADGKLSEVNRFLDLGANVHASNERALIAAAGRGHLEVVNRLIDAKADVNYPSGNALSSASVGARLEIINRLIDARSDVHGKNESALRSAVESAVRFEGEYKYSPIIQTLCEHKADPNIGYRHSQGYEKSALALATEYNKPNIISILENCGSSESTLTKPAARQEATTGGSRHIYEYKIRKYQYKINQLL